MASPRKESPQDAGAAVVVVDMLNPYDHDDADLLAASVAQTLDPIRSLIGAASERDLPVIYVNDNYGDWNSSPEELAQRAMEGERPELVEPILPPDDALFVIKARHTVFYETPLNYLLTQIGAQAVVLAGQVTEQCILYSALDAYVRHLEVRIPRDGVAHIHSDLADAACRMMERNMDATIAPASDLDTLFADSEKTERRG